VKALIWAYLLPRDSTGAWALTDCEFRAYL
jgi:hypothetical protein